MLEEDGQTVEKRLDFLPEFFMQKMAQSFHRAAAIAVFPEMASDWVEFYFVMRLLQPRKKMFNKKSILEFGLEQANSFILSFFPFHSANRDEVKKVDLSFSFSSLFHSIEKAAGESLICNLVGFAEFARGHHFFVRQVDKNKPEDEEDH